MIQVTAKEAIKTLLDNNETTIVNEFTPVNEVLDIIQDRVSKLNIGKGVKSLVKADANSPLVITNNEKALLPIFYVYNHKDENGKLVYIGIGFDGRANEGSLRRKTTHAQWLLNETLNRRNPVTLVHEFLTKYDSEIIESYLLNQFELENGTLPKFNKSRGRVLTTEDIARAIELIG